MSTTKEEKELSRFVTDPKYRQKVIAKVHRDRDAEYNDRIQKLKRDKANLISAQSAEINRIENSRWERLPGGRIAINRTEGKARIGNSEVLFSDVKGAEARIENGYRVITQQSSKSKKHTSLGGAVMGGLVLGPVGAVVGGVGLGKTTSKGVSSSTQIPVCNHVGVLMNINGFTSEITLLEKQVDQSSTTYKMAVNTAQALISQLQGIARMPVPETYSSPNEEDSVLSFNPQIEQKDIDIQKAIEMHPTYELPDLYKTEEQKNMADEEYLTYLKNEDDKRKDDAQKLKDQKAYEKQQLKEEKKAQRQAAREARGLSGSISVTEVIVSIVFWVLSLFLLIMSFGSILQGYIVSTIVFLIAALFINPIIFGIICNKMVKIPVWVCIIVFIVGFIGGCMLTPSKQTTVTKNNNVISYIQMT